MAQGVVLLMPSVSSVCFRLDAVWDPNEASELPGYGHRKGLGFTQYSVKEMLVNCRARYIC